MRRIAEIADTMMGIYRNAKTVLAQVGPVNGEFRTCELERIGGEDQSVTVHVESKCRYFVDVKACYFWFCKVFGEGMSM